MMLMYFQIVEISLLRIKEVPLSHVFYLVLLLMQNIIGARSVVMGHIHD